MPTSDRQHAKHNTPIECSLGIGAAANSGNSAACGDLIRLIAALLPRFLNSSQGRH